MIPKRAVRKQAPTPPIESKTATTGKVATVEQAAAVNLNVLTRLFRVEHFQRGKPDGT